MSLRRLPSVGRPCHGQAPLHGYRTLKHSIAPRLSLVQGTDSNGSSTRPGRPLPLVPRTCRSPRRARRTGAAPPSARAPRPPRRHAGWRRDRGSRSGSSDSRELAPACAARRPPRGAARESETAVAPRLRSAASGRSQQAPADIASWYPARRFGILASPPVGSLVRHTCLGRRVARPPRTPQAPFIRLVVAPIDALRSPALHTAAQRFRSSLRSVGRILLRIRLLRLLPL